MPVARDGSGSGRARMNEQSRIAGSGQAGTTFDRWAEAPGEEYADAMVASMAAGGVDHLFFVSGSEIAFYQESIAKARTRGHKTLRLITVPHEQVALNAALGFAAVTGRPAATAVHVDVGTQHYGGAIHSAWRANQPVLITAGAPPTALTGSLRGARDD